MRAGLRLTDLLARLHVFTGPLPERPPVVERVPVVEPVETTPASQVTPGVVSTGSTTGLRTPGVVSTGSTTGLRTPGVVSTGSTTGLRISGTLLDDALAGVSDASRASILDPLDRSRDDRPRVGHPVRVSLPYLSDGAAPTTPAPARQVDETTCGAAVLAMLAMAGDPWLALQVARDPTRRFAALQERVHRACARTGPVPWPRRFGTAPWAAAAVARFGDTRFTHRVVGGARGAEVLTAAVAAASSGVPVPLFTGGDLGGGWQAAVPRHVVLLTDAHRDDVGPAGGSDIGGPGNGVVRIYEPSSATVHTVPMSTLLDPDAATPRDRAALSAALGHWPHVVWTLLPR